MDKRTTEIEIAFNRGQNDAKLGRTRNPYDANNRYAENEAWVNGQAHYEDERDADYKRAA